MSSGDFLDNHETAEDRLMELMIPSDYLSQEDCEIGAVYWGIGRSIGEAAICQPATTCMGIGFEGLRNKLGEDSLFTEHHHDADPVFGTFKPFVKIANLEPGLNEQEKMDFLLDQTIEIQELKMEWLENLPDTLRPSTEYIYSENAEYLQYLLGLRADGFCDHRTISFRTIMDSIGTR